MSDQKYYNLLIASNIALQSNVSVKHGSIITSKNKIIASGYNTIEAVRKKLLIKYGPIKMGCTVHAETAAIHNMLNNLRYGLDNTNIKRKKFDIYIARDTMNFSKPCRNCITLMKHFGIYRAIYSDNTNKNGYIMEKVSDIDSVHISFGDKSILIKRNIKVNVESKDFKDLQRLKIMYKL